MNKKFYVYEHIRLDTNHVFYVGKGLYKRAWSKDNRNSYWKNIVNQCGYLINILEYFDDEESAFNREKQLIMWHKFFGNCEANLSCGGVGGNSGCTPWNKGIPRSKETIEKIANKLTGKNISQETKKKISISGIGKRRSEKTKLLMSQVFMGRKFKNGSGLNISIARGSRKFSVFKALGSKRNWSKGEYIGAWINKQECARDLKLDSSCIGLCLIGKRSQHGGYIFESN